MFIFCLYEELIFQLNKAYYVAEMIPSRLSMGYQNDNHFAARQPLLFTPHPTLDSKS